MARLRASSVPAGERDRALRCAHTRSPRVVTATDTPAASEAALEELSTYVDTVVVKLGSKGSLVRRNGVTARIPVFPASVADTTGAGDSYAGAFLYGWLQGWTPAQCGELGSRVAALTVGQVGAVVRDQAGLMAVRSLVGGAT